MSQNHPPIPRLDLAPKLKRPLSLWNPLDYLRLLYWVFYFPQALRWYESTFGGESSLKDAKTWREKWDWLRQNSVKRQLILQAFVLIIVIPIGFLRKMRYAEGCCNPYSIKLFLEPTFRRCGFDFFTSCENWKSKNFWVEPMRF